MSNIITLRSDNRIHIVPDTSDIHPGDTIINNGRILQVIEKLNVNQSSDIHNPMKVSDEKLNTKEGWRLLYKDEILKNRRYSDGCVQVWDSAHGEWVSNCAGNSRNLTYRTKLSREQLNRERCFIE